ncbi:hypothetical protein [Sulfuricystis multivorans]|uniref:hypothetical protein n=1 Tax=Sulfuricystis multivorans TaxID=2211108 RepID=UPI000F83897D|nr:hypothetical protein [Sulfuricystis multivorans]
MAQFFRNFVPVLLGCLLAAGCEQLGFPDPAKVEAAREAEGRAIGGACRHSGRALEDCYKLNPKASKAAIYAGWRDMDAYMRENNIPIVPSSSSSARKPAEDKPATDESAAKAKPSPAAASPSDAPAAPARRST